MKYKLKDKELAEHLRAIYPEFDKELESVCDSQMNDGCDCVLIKIYGPKGPRLNLLIFKPEIEAIYDPKSWNIFPSVTPPKDKLMWLEYWGPSGAFHRTCGKYATSCGDPCWVDVDGNILDFERLYFRPWED